MTEQQTPVMEHPAGAPATPPVTPPPAPKKKKRKGKGKMIAGLVIAAVVVVAVIVLVWYFVLREDTDKGNAMTDFVMRGSIQSTVEGYGLTRAKDSATISPTAGGTILELYVQEGEQVTEGQQLYRMDDSAAQDTLLEAQKVVDNCQKELQAVYDKIAELNITAPHAGNLREVAELKVGDTVTEGDTIATVVNDTRLKLSLYYSYAYENDIKVGQTAQISLPATMGSLTGTVEEINKVRFVSPEGAVHFEVVLVLDNSGTLTEGMDASAALTAADGSPVYPYENGKLEYYETTVVKAKASGPVEAVNLLNYADVKAGAQLVLLGAKDTDEEIASKENALKAAQEKLVTASDELAKYNAVAPISGTVLSCNLTAGAEVASGQGITIADTSVMTIEINVDERNIQYVKTGMGVDINYNGNYYMGTVVSVALTGNAENGMSTFPAIVQVENPDGAIMSNSYADYSFVASQSLDCLLVPTIAVKYVSFANVPGMGGDPGMDPGFVDPGMEGGDPGIVDPGMDGSDGDAGLTDDGATDGDAGLTDDGATDGDAGLTDDGATDGDAGLTDGGMTGGEMDAPAQAMPVPGAYAGGGAYARSLGMMVMPAGGGSISIGGSSGSSGGSTGGFSGQTDDGTGYVVFVKADQAPENAILEPDPTWECPEGFWTIPVQVGLSNTTQVEILSGLNEGDEVFIGYETQSSSSWG